MELEILKEKLEELNNKQILKVFKIIYYNKEQYVINETGLYIPINLLKIETINELKYYLNKNVIKPNESLERLKNLKKPSLSHQEKYLLKKINLNDDLL
jgi:hypothetical protein